MRAAKICQPRDHDTCIGDRLLKRCEMDPWIAGRVMCEGRERVAIGLRDILSRDSATQLTAGVRLQTVDEVRRALRVAGRVKIARLPISFVRSVTR